MKTELNMEKRLRALSAHTPSPILDTERLGREIEKHNKLIRIMKPVSTAAAAIVLITSAVIITSAIARRQVASTVTIDSAARITVGVNSDNEVVDISAGDQRGKHALLGFEQSGSDPQEVTAALVTHLIENDTLNEYDNTLLVTADCADDAEEEALRKTVSDAVSHAYQENHFNGALLSQNTDNDDTSARIASRYHVSRGKAQLLRELIGADSTMSYHSLSRMNVNDLNLIADSIDLDYTDIVESGDSSALRYIEEDEAIKIVVDHLDSDGNKKDISVQIRLDARDGELLYRLKIRDGKTTYSYQLVASSGEIVTVLKIRGDKTEIIIDRRSSTAPSDDHTPAYTPAVTPQVNTPADDMTEAPQPTEADKPPAAPAPTVQPTAPSAKPSKPAPTSAPTQKPTEGASSDATPDTVSFTSANCYRVPADMMAAGFNLTGPPDTAEKVDFTEVFRGRSYGDNPQKVQTFDSGTAAVICSKTQLKRFLSEYSDSFSDDAGKAFSTSAYTDSWFSSHALVVTYYAMYNMDYDFTVTDMVKDGKTLYVNTAMSAREDLPHTAYSAHDLSVYAISRADLTADTQLSLY